MPATLLARKFRTEQARALLGGCAAHAFSPLSQPMSSSVGMALICAGHHYGWPVARGGSRAISDALAAVDARARREHRDRAAGDLAVGAAAGRRGRARPRARRGRRASRGRGCPRASPAHTGATATARARSRSTSRSRAACRGRTRRRGGRARCTWADRSRRSRGRARDQPRADARAPVRARLPAVARRPDAGERRCPPGVGLRARAERLYGRRDARRCSTRSNASPRACASGSSRRPCARRASSSATTRTTSAATSSPARTRRVQTRDPPAAGARPLQHGHPGVFICSAATPPGAGAHGMNGYNAGGVGATRPAVTLRLPLVWPARARSTGSLAGEARRAGTGGR